MALILPPLAAVMTVACVVAFLILCMRAIDAEDKKYEQSNDLRH